VKPWPLTISLPQGHTVSGVTTWAVTLAEALADAGREARLVFHRPHNAYRELSYEPGATRANLRVIHAPDITDPAARPHCVRMYRDLLPTVLSPNLLAESYAIAAGLASVYPDAIRVIGWNHTDNPYDYACLSYYEPIIERFLCVSRRCVERLTERVRHRAEDVRHLPHGVPAVEVPPRRAMRGRAIRLVYAGRLEQSGKRVLDFVDLARELDRRGIAFELRIIGDGPRAAELAERIGRAAPAFRTPGARMGLEPPLPSADGIREAWCWADAYLLNSAREGFSLAMTEAMASGCIPIVSDVPSGVGDIIRDQGNGLTFPQGDILALADRIAWLAGQSETTVRAMSVDARRAIEAACSYPRYLESVRQTLDAVQTGPDRSWPPTRPLLMDGTGTGDSATVPADAADRLRRVLAGIADAGEGPVAVFGAGKHTRALAGVLADSPVRIATIIDEDDRLVGRTLWGWPVVTPEGAAATGARTVVISSWLHEREISARLGSGWEQDGLRVRTLYEESGPIPHQPLTRNDA
jgi:glycosyltransferase involved in cell wall biosynthesis